MSRPEFDMHELMRTQQQAKRVGFVIELLLLTAMVAAIWVWWP